MQTLATDTSSAVGHEPDAPIRIWIEHEDGSIARGLIEIVSRDGAVVRLTNTDDSLASGNDVAVRIAFSRTDPTLAGTAHVVWVQRSGETAECEVRWTHTGLSREQLAMVVASLS